MQNREETAMRKAVFLLISVLWMGVLTGCERPVMGAVENPPTLKVCCGEVSLDLEAGAYTWSISLQNGQTMEKIADCMHPLDQDGELPQLTGEGGVTLSWEVSSQPDSVAVRCWPESQLGNVSAQSTEVPWEGKGFQLKEGGWIYEVTARWNHIEGWGGSASYAFSGIG